MEAPVVPMSPNRLVRDFTVDDALSNYSYAQVTGPSRESDRQTPPQRNSQESRITAFRTASTRSSSLRVNAETRSQQFQSPDLQSPDSRPPDVGTLDAQIVDNLRNADFNLGAIDERNTYEHSVADRSVTAASQRTEASFSSTNRLPDFFGSEIFQLVLHTPTTARQLLLFSQSRLCGENMEFLEKVDQYHTLLNDVTKTMFEIHRDFVSPSAPSQINTNESLLVKINKDLKFALTSILPKMESIFLDAQNDIEALVSSDIYPRFVRHQLSLSATKALAKNRSRYAGLGDCFVLTSPSKADNPIVYASDGFVDVTGYQRNEIIPRNCRFLQGRYTDRPSVARLRNAIDRRRESVELLLNYKKNGEPFWNLLYTAPLFDLNGNVVFFIGGQINCSTTIHNASDIIRILSFSADVEDPTDSKALAPPTVRSSRVGGIFKAFKNYGAPKLEPALRPAGMENELLNHIEKMDMKKQMEIFYTSYSKYLVINYTTFFISFYSAGIIELLYPYKASTMKAEIVGTDIFRFLSSHSANNPSRDFKSTVKSALRVGQAVSLDLKLCTRRYMGFEKFVTHWTPLKDDTGKVEFVVLTLGGVQD